VKTTNGNFVKIFTRDASLDAEQKICCPRVIGVARGREVQWVQVHPRARNTIFVDIIYEGNL